MRRALTTTTALLLLAAAGARAQESPVAARTGPMRGYAGFGLALAAPVGVFGDYVGGGIGGTAHFGWYPEAGGPLSIRGDFAYVVYGYERNRIPFPTAPRVGLDLTTTNNIVTYNVGPQLQATRGAIRPYANAFVGGAYFFTQSSLSGTGSDGGTFASSENYHDSVLSYGAGGGVLIPVKAGAQPVSIDLAARYVHNGTVHYLRKGDIHDDGGTVTYSPQVSPANLVQFTIGASVGIR